jgi:hypothetical protein
MKLPCEECRYTTERARGWRAMIVDSAAREEALAGTLAEGERATVTRVRLDFRLLGASGWVDVAVQGNGKRTQHSLRAGESKGRESPRRRTRLGQGSFLGHVGRFGDWRGVTRRARLFEATRPPRARSDLISHSADSRGVRGGGDRIAEAGASALASASSQLRLTPASHRGSRSGRERGGEQGENVSPNRCDSLGRLVIPQDWPPAEALTSSRLTAILRPGSDSRNATFGRGSSAFQPRLELPRLLTFRTSRAQASRDAGGESRR